MNIKTQTTIINSELIFQYLLYTTSFLIPFLISQSQLVVGSIVNCMLFLAAGRLSNKHHLPLALLPSLAALARGHVFGLNTSFIILFLPFIWIGNLILMSIVRNDNGILRVRNIVIASSIKASVLALLAMFYIQIGLVPDIFLSAMGLVQFETALIGGVLALGFTKLLERDSIGEPLPILPT